MMGASCSRCWEISPFNFHDNRIFRYAKLKSPKVSSKIVAGKHIIHTHHSSLHTPHAPSGPYTKIQEAASHPLASFCNHKDSSYDEVI
jgi:hypothetical protein